MRTRTISTLTQVSLDELKRSEGYAPLIRSDPPSQRDGIIGQRDRSAALGCLDVSLGVPVTGETGDLSIAGVHRLQKFPISRQRALD